MNVRHDHVTTDILKFGVFSLVTGMLWACSEPEAQSQDFGEDLPRGSKFLGHIESVGELPEGRSVAVMQDGTAFLLPEGALPVYATAPAQGGSEAAQVANGADASNSMPNADSRSSDSDEVAVAQQAISAVGTLFLQGVTEPDFRFAAYDMFNSGNIDSSQARTVDLNTDPVCSGSYIGPRHILTAAHCVYYPSLKRWNQPTAVIPARQGNCAQGTCLSGINEKPLGEKRRFTTVVPTSWINSGDQASDQAVVILQNSASWGTWFGVNFGVPSYAPSVVIARGYPSPKPYPCAHSPLPSGSGIFDPPYDKHCGGFQYWSPGNMSDSSGDYLFAWTDTSAGMSGGPLLQGEYVFGSLIGTDPSTYRAAFRRTMSWLICGAFRDYPSTNYPHGCN